MKIGSSGAGHIGGNAGRLFAWAGHEVLFSFSRDPQALAAAAASSPRARMGTPPKQRPSVMSCCSRCPGA